MIRNRILMKAFAVFFLIETVSNIVAPPVLLALTSGPTAPEATSFEPVDTTDMINAITGDFVYSVPLLEVPGPSGGYPLALSYHAGIQPGVDASWVGLGFSLNPGSINRIVNGVPDDFDAARTSNQVFWEGGQTTENTYGITVGIGSYATVTAGLAFANDTYRGHSVGAYVGAGLQVANSPGSMNFSVGVSPYGGGNASLGIGRSSATGMNVGANVGISVNDQGKVAAGTGLTFASMDVSMNTDGRTTASAGLAGFKTSSNNSRSGNISSFSDDVSFDIPAVYGIGIRLGRSYTRYWQYEKENYQTYGSLNFPDFADGEVDKKVFDSYHITGMESILNNTIPQKYTEGSLADYDQYSVNAQGLGGNFRPYHYALSLATQDVIKESDNSKDVLNYAIPQQSIGVGYRFINDFSNRVLNDAPDVLLNHTLQGYSGPNQPEQDYMDWFNRMSAVYGPSENIPFLFPYKSVVTGSDDSDLEENAKRRLPNVPGSKHIEYFKNADILDRPEQVRGRGFIECTAPGFTRSKDEDGQVGAFVITNSSGVNYHFALPAYASQEHVYTQNKDTHNKISLNNLSQLGRYAYTWYLTGVTGPDYVDRGPDGNADGKLNEYDWGYWVSFEYGKWTDVYHWRNPALGFRNDVDNRFQTFSKGMKELYYLNAIRTASHTALFVKEIRADGKGESPRSTGSVAFTYGNTDISYVDDGTFVPSTASRVEGGILFPNSVDYSILPAATLSLKSIILFKNGDLPGGDLNNLSDKYNDTFAYEWSTKYDWTVNPFLFTTHYGENVLDVNDYQSEVFSTDKIMRRIDLTYDYSLAPETVNSFDADGALYDCGGCTKYFPNDSHVKSKLGKLTLKSVSFKGKACANLLPPMQFSYDYATPASTSAIVVSVNTTSSMCSVGNFNATAFNVGDIVRIAYGTSTCYGYIVRNSSAAQVKIIFGALPEVGTHLILTQTKNPPYNDELYDMWGYYKQDYVKTDDRNLDRFPSELSAKNTDVWSLRSIATSLGSVINIDYEPDTYGKSVLSESLTIPLELSNNEMENTPPNAPGNPTKVFLEASLDEFSPIDFSKVYKVGDVVELAGGGSGCSTVELPPGTTGDSQTCGSYLIREAEVQEVTSKYIRMRFYIGFETIQSFYGCVMRVKLRPEQKGGGIRVKSVELVDNVAGTSRKTQYTYDFEGTSSGVTSYEPINIENISSVITNDALVDMTVKGYLIRPFIKMMALSRDVPAPGVYYGKVRVRESFTPLGGIETIIPGFTEYEFQTFDDSMIGITQTPMANVSTAGTYRGQSYNAMTGVRNTLRDFTSRIGNLKSVTLFDDEGIPVTQTLYHFLHDEQTDVSYAGNSSQYRTLLSARNHSQGQIEEVFNHGRLVKVNAATNVMQGLITKREAFPTVPTGTTTIQYKTGLKAVSRIQGYDFYSGQPLITVVDDGYGNSLRTEKIPAYHVYPAMGLKAFHVTDHSANRHMLDQEAATYVYKVEPFQYAGQLGFVSASAQTWTNQTPVLNREDLSQGGHQESVWRKGATYSFIGNDAVALQADGLYPVGDVGQFDAWAWGAATPAGWQKSSEITLYDVQSHALEARDINDNYAATRMLSDHARIGATVANARYNEFAYSGAEDFDTRNVSGNAVLKGGGVINTDYHHTGSNSLALGGGQSGFETLLTLEPGNYDRRMHVSFWVYQPALQPVTVQYQFTTGENLTSPASQAIDLQKVRRAGDWVLCEMDIAASRGTVQTNSHLIVRLLNSGSIPVYVDDFRVHPTDATVTSYVYNSWNELSHILDNNNLYTEYRYDGMGRLISTYKESFQGGYGNTGVVKTGEIIYNYGKGHVYNVSLTSSFSGSSGQLSPSGTITVQQGRDVVFNIYENCSESDLETVYVDNIPLNLNLGETTLFDGTKIQVQGNLLTFKGVLTNHTLSARFQDYGIGIVECHVAQLPTGSCFDGTYDYRYYDACGVLGEVFHANTKADIPANLRGLAPFDNCKVLNGPTPCDNNNQN